MTANPDEGEVAFEANGERYVLQFNIRSLRLLEKEAGKGIVALINDLQDPSKMSMTLVCQVLWAGLQKHHPDIDLDTAGELIPAAGGLMTIIGLFNEGFTAAFPEAGDDKNPRRAGGPKANGTGPRSIEPGAGSDVTRKPSGEGRPARSR